ncbi:hypothetical protein [Nostoc sp. UHCC 0252]|uniref:hypothetical protein n=1 Tax=Nostoc sp. UHCC 0252 TaxID=3110241 RepID=UPI002B1FE34D|nr:hypothetical protein [Nostoc sp. UHCC 0252]MEA5605183.1 hypothetical protein [Nostoc sp. UHCC 0252]
MYSLSSKFSIIFQQSICLLSLVSGNFLAAPANAQQATATGAVTLIRPSGTFLSISGEVTLPSGSYFEGGLQITPIYGGVAGTNEETVNSLTITPGIVKTTTLSNPNSFTNTAANLLNNSNSVEDVTTLIQAGAGNNGLGALD